MLRFVAIATCVSILNGCTVGPLIDTQVRNERSATRVDVEGISVRFYADFPTRACRAAYSFVGVEMPEETSVEKGTEYLTCKVVRFTPKVRDLNERVRLAGLALDSAPAMRRSNVSDADIKRASAKYLNTVGPLRLYPAQLMVPATVVRP